MAISDLLPFQTEPDVVDRAPRRERWKRQAWMIASTMLAFGAVMAVADVIHLLAPWFPPTGRLGLTVAAFAVVIAFGLDLWLFSWGVGRFDLVAPWQFREVDEGD